MDPDRTTLNVFDSLFIKLNELWDQAPAFRLTNDPQDPFFKDTCEEHENGKSRPQHTELQTEAIPLSQKQSQNTLLTNTHQDAAH